MIGATVRKPHHAAGEAHYASRLSWPDARMIRHRRECPACRPFSSLDALSVEFGVSRVMIHHIEKGRSWHPDHDPAPAAVACPITALIRRVKGGAA